MNQEKVVFAFFSILALTLNYGFFIGDMADPTHHNAYELFAALVVSLIATIMKFGDRAHIGSLLLATSLVADLHLIMAAIVWGYASYVLSEPLEGEMMSRIVSLSGGALQANLTSVSLLVVETVTFRR